MRVELSTGAGKGGSGNRGDRRGFDRGGGRPRPYPPGPPRRGLPPPPPDFDRYDPYYRYAYPERDPYFRLHPADRYLPPRLPPSDRYGLPPRDRLLPEERGYLPPDPRDRLMARERLPPYPEDRAAAYDRLRSSERAPLPADPYYRSRSPPPPAARPPPEYYDNASRKQPLMRNPPPAGTEAAAPRLGTTSYPPADGYDYYRKPAAAAERPSYGAPGTGGDYYAAASRPGAGYDRSAGQQASAGGYGSQQSKGGYDSQAALQTQPIFF